MASEFLYWDESSDQFQILIAKLRQSYIYGYSVIELARILNHRNATKLYAVMRNHGIIPKLTRKRQKKYEIPTALETALKKSGISYIQWCTAHGLDVERSVSALREGLDDYDPDSMAVHNAFIQDFPTLYAKFYGTPHPDLPDRSYYLRKEQRTDYSVLIVLNKQTKAYDASIPELPFCCATGRSRDEAYLRLKKEYVIHMSIAKLELLPPKDQ